MTLKVCLDARLISGVAGGVEQAIIGLAAGLASSPGEEAIHYLTFPDHEEWLLPFVGPDAKVLHSTETPFPRSLKGKLKVGVPGLERLLRTLPATKALKRAGPRHSDGVIEAAGIEVMHFPHQIAFFTEIPTIYQPFDLQHVHLPEMFTARERAFREESYRAHCERASAVVVMTSWAKRDVVGHYGLDEGKVYAIPLGAPTTAYQAPTDEQVRELIERTGIPPEFAFYPAQTWPHKNHLTLLEALVLARDVHGHKIPVVCSGVQNEHFETIRNRVEQLGLADQVHFLGFLQPLEVRSLYRAAHCLIFPSRFEGWALPICEAFDAGVPVACSNVTSLPDLVGDAALLFDPLDAAAIAEALAHLWEDASLRRSLVQRGRERAIQFGWKRTAMMFRALYRKVGGARLSNAQKELLTMDPLV